MTDATEPQACPLSLDSLSAAVQRHAGPKAPAPLKLMAARGMAPMPPRDLVTTQFILTFDGDAKVKQSAEKSLAELDGRIANAILGDTQLPSEILAYLARALARNDAYAEKLLLNPATPPAAFVDVARLASEQICEIIANNQARILEEPDIARALTDNPNVLKSTLDRVVDFLVRSGVILEGLTLFEEAFLRLNGEDRVKAADAIALPEHLLDERFQDEGQRRLIDEDEEEVEEDDKKRSIQSIIREMNTAQKIAFATKGNKSARSELMRDTNRLVAVAAITSPAITETEIIAAAQSRTVNADVITHICRDKKNNWIRIYQVKVALVNNPKTPLPEALKFVPTLNKRDMKLLAKSKNVPAGFETEPASSPRPAAERDARRLLRHRVAADRRLDSSAAPQRGHPSRPRPEHPGGRGHRRRAGRSALQRSRRRGGHRGGPGAPPHPAAGGRIRRHRPRRGAHARGPRLQRARPEQPLGRRGRDLPDARARPPPP